MEILVERKWKKPEYTIGVLSIDGKEICNTLEDTDRGLRSDMAETTLRNRKYKGATAIPTGRYEVTRTWSPRFKMALPLLSCVPAFSAIRIHAGNTAADTEGCILVGKNKKKGMVLDSRKWLGVVDMWIEDALKRNEKVWVTIR